jgi:hypothetical protein
MAKEGAVGFLSNVKRDAELIRRSGFYAKQIEPVMALLDAAITTAREHNKVSEPAAENSPAESTP